MSPMRIFIVDDNFVARRGLRSFLETEADISLAGEASTGRAAVEWVKNKAVDIVLMDVRMPDLDGIEATTEIMKVRPETKVLVLTVVDDQPTLLRALLAGARGYLVYGRFTPENLISAVRAIASGEVVTVPPIASPLLDHIRSHLANVQDMAEMEHMEPLTNREKEILSLIAVGKGNRDIAVALNVEEKTVKNHINNIYSKLQIKSRYEAISYMFRAH
jgi:DNA-binding NarL/FixJ family response regulator